MPEKYPVPNPDVLPEEWDISADAPFLTFAQWELIAEAAAMFGSANVEQRGALIHVPWSAEMVARSASFGRAVVAGCGLFDTVFTPGCWIDTAPIAA